jgi:hypothetical protein
MPTLFITRRVEIGGKVIGPNTKVDIKDDKLIGLLCRNGVAHIIDAPKKDSK